jgi:hypothetical protein
MKKDLKIINKRFFLTYIKRIIITFFLIVLGILPMVLISGCEEELPQINDRIVPNVSNESADTELGEEPITLDLRPLSSIDLALSEPDPDGAELLGVRFAAEGGYVMVEFKSPRELAENWNEGSIFLLEEKTGITYWDIPQVPVLGLLLGKPQEEGQKGYAMFKNIAAGIKTGSVVTVVLGNYKREHINIK